MNTAVIKILNKYSCFIILAMISLISQSIIGQEVTISSDISVKKDFSYDILGEIDDEILLFRDLGFRFEVNAFDKDLASIWEREIRFEKRKVDIVGIVPRDNDFTIYYTFGEKGKKKLMARRFDSRAELIDSSTVYITEKNMYADNFAYAISENKKHVLVLHTDRGKRMNFVVVNHDSLNLSLERQLEFDESVMLRSFKDAVIDNQGNIYTLLEIDNTKFKRKKHRAIVLKIDAFREDPKRIEVPYQSLLSVDIAMTVDNKNRSLIIAGLYSNESNYKAQGYYFLNLDQSFNIPNPAFKFESFKKELMKDVLGQKYNKNNSLNDFKIKEIIARGDGGCVFVAELDKKLTRRSGYPGTGFNNQVGRRPSAWVDHYNEDVILLAINKRGDLHWNSVLYKKQFAQDEEIAYSSFFLFKTPSLLRIIYNDEIKRDNTVSEYLIDPLGRKRRSSLFSTEYEDLKLRFNSAVQISSSAFIVPSEIGSKMSLVRIQY